MPEPEETTTQADGGEFARLIAEEVAAKPIEIGQIVRGRIIQLGPQDVFLDIGAKTEGHIATAELLDKEGNLTAKVGDVVEATVVRHTHEEIRLSRKLLQGAQAAEALETAARTKLPVQGKVASVIKGGFEVNVLGQRAFCPLSQIDIRRTGDPQSYVGQVLEFRIIEFRERG